jgi:prepilin-type processing-associated H-X9-DG protein
MEWAGFSLNLPPQLGFTAVVKADNADARKQLASEIDRFFDDGLYRRIKRSHSQLEEQSIQKQLLAQMLNTIESLELTPRDEETLAVKLDQEQTSQLIRTMVLPAVFWQMFQMGMSGVLQDGRQLGLALYVYQSKNEEQSPESLQQLFESDSVSEIIPNPEVFYRSAGEEKIPRFVYVRPISQDPQNVVAYANITGWPAVFHHAATLFRKGVYRGVVFADGHVEWMDQLSFEKALQRTRIRNEAAAKAAEAN